jgi:hypothetical protein
MVLLWAESGTGGGTFLMKEFDGVINARKGFHQVKHAKQLV